MLREGLLRGEKRKKEWKERKIIKEIGSDSSII